MVVIVFVIYFLECCVIVFVYCVGWELVIR